MVANRGEIAIRIIQSAKELGLKTLSVYSFEDRYQAHRSLADENVQIGKDTTPVGAYLNIQELIKVALDHNVSAIHPGYGFLSENSGFAEECEAHDIIFVGPKPMTLKSLGDKTESKRIAHEVGVPTIPGSGPIESIEQAREFVEKYGLPVMIKAIHGGGGRGMRRVSDISALGNEIESARSEAQTLFGDGSIYLERFMEGVRHIEVQILADSIGNVVHLYERDCSVQRRNQKVLEMAPARFLDPLARAHMITDAIKIASHTGYRSAGTVEFLLDGTGSHYFIEVNPRVQVEHTVTEEVIGIDIVKSQLQIASGMSLKEIDIVQDRIQCNGFAIQSRVTTEDPRKGFEPDFGTIQVAKIAAGGGIRLDSTEFCIGTTPSEHYDSLLTKVTAKSRTFEDSVAKLKRSLTEFNIQGVKTNIPFTLNLLQNEVFMREAITTDFLQKTPELFDIGEKRDPLRCILHYLGNCIVNGCKIEGADQTVVIKNPLFEIPRQAAVQDGQRQQLLKLGPAEWAKSIMAFENTLFMDTTMRDAHQSLLMTRMRTIDLLSIANHTAEKLNTAYSLEMWGGATFDVSLRFLHECPWERLIRLRELIPNIPFQMLLRGANAVGYKAYPDNVVYKFVRESQKHGIDIFRVFDSLNYLPNLKIGIDAVGEAGGVIEAAICYTGDITKSSKYNSEYYLELVRKLVGMGIHVLSIKDMAGLLKPGGASVLVSHIRTEFPNLPVHVHTHDTSGTGIASMAASVAKGAQIVDVAIDSMSGMTSQPSMGAMIATLEGTSRPSTIKLKDIQELNDYWENTREYYAPFESNQKSGSSNIYFNEIPGGQYTNMLFQSKSLGIGESWSNIKKAYAEANQLLGDIIKVTPSSKVVGDLAQFMISNKLSPQDVIGRAETLDFPHSLVEFFQGDIGIPHGGFPEPFRTQVLRGDVKTDGRPGEHLQPLEFDDTKQSLQRKFPEYEIKDQDVMSWAMYPKEFEDFVKFVTQNGPVTNLKTIDFLRPMKLNEEISVELTDNNVNYIKFQSQGETNKETGNRDLYFVVNGQLSTIQIKDISTKGTERVREKYDPADEGSIGATLQGVVINLKVKPGHLVSKGDTIATISAMKMETTIRAPISGEVEKLGVHVGDKVKPGDLLALIK